MRITQSIIDQLLELSRVAEISKSPPPSVGGEDLKKGPTLESCSLPPPHVCTGARSYPYHTETQSQYN